MVIICHCRTGLRGQGCLFRMSAHLCMVSSRAEWILGSSTISFSFFRVLRRFLGTEAIGIYAKMSIVSVFLGSTRASLYYMIKCWVLLVTGAVTFRFIPVFAKRATMASDLSGIFLVGGRGTVSLLFCYPATGWAGGSVTSWLRVVLAR